MAKPDPTQQAPSRQPKLEATAGSRGRFIGFWPLLQQYGMLKTKNSRLIGDQGVPGACSSTLRHQMAKLEWKIVTDDGQESEETEYYTLLLENARDAEGALIGGSGLFDLMAQDILNAHEAGNCEVVRLDSGPNEGVPIGLYYMDAATLRRVGGDYPVRQIEPDSQQEYAKFREDEVMHICWNRYTTFGRQWYNRHPVQAAWIAINCLAAGDDYNYSLLTEVIPQGLLNLGPGFTKEKAMEWRDAWQAARQSGKLEDIGLLWGTDKAEFIRLTQPLTEQPFQHMSYWYLTIVTATYEMSPLDIGFMTQLNTKAAAEQQAELSKNKGLGHLLGVLSYGVGRWILPSKAKDKPGLRLSWPDLDASDELTQARVRLTNTQAISIATGKKAWMSKEAAQEESVRLEAFEDCGELPDDPPPPQFGDGNAGDGESDEGEELAGGGVDEDADASSDDGVGKSVAKAGHSPRRIELMCPICKICDEVDQYDDHGGLCVCVGCGKTFDPAVEVGYS